MIRVALCVGFLVGAGCGSPRELPVTYPATGQVVFKNGEPVPEGTIQFVSTSQSPHTVTGAIKDGSFALRTVVAGEPIDGAIPGTYQATVILASADQTVPPITLPQRLSVRADAKNHFKLVLDRIPSKNK